MKKTEVRKNDSKNIFYDWILGIKKDAEHSMNALRACQYSLARENLSEIIGRCESILTTLDFAEDNKKMRE